MQRWSERQVILAISMASAFFMPFMLSSVNVAMPAIGREFSVNAVTLSWVATAYLLSAAVFLLPFGRIADIYGKKKIFQLGILSFALTTFLCSLAPNIRLLIAFRAFQGMSSAMIFGTGTAILTSAFPTSDRGRVLGLNVASVYLGLSLGPVLGGVLTQHIGWRSLFWVTVPFSLALAGMIWLWMKNEWISAKDETFDWFGSVFYGASLLSVFFGFSHLPSNFGIGFLILGIVGLIGFGVYQTKIKSPILNVQVFRHNRVFVFSSLAALINYSATYAIAFLVSLYLQYAKGLTPQNAGFIMMSQPVMQAAFSPFAGRLSDRVESRKIATSGMLLTAIGLFLMTFLSNTTPIVFVIGALLLLGIGFAFFSSPNTNAVMGAVEKKYYGVASGLLGTMRLTGQMFSMAVTTLIFALIIGNNRSLHDNPGLFLKSETLIFIILTVLCTIGIFFSLARGKAKTE